MTPEERIERVRDMTRRGMSASQIAAVLGITPRHVVRLRHPAGVAREPAAPITDEQWNRARQLLDDGCSFDEVARTVGIASTHLAHRFPGRGWTRSQIGQWRAYLLHHNNGFTATNERHAA